MRNFMNLFKRFEVNGYNPLSMFNVVLSIIALVGVLSGGIITVEAIESDGFGDGMKLAFSSNSMYAGIIFLVGLASFIFLVVRNMKIGSIPKIIMFTVIQLLLGALIAFIFIIAMFFKGLGTNPDDPVGSLKSSSSSNSGNQDTSSSKPNKQSAYDYTSGQDELARSYGFADSEDAKQHGIDTKTML